MSGQGLLLSSINKYFKQNNSNLDDFIKILNGKSKISLRLLDWLVTHYSKKKNTIYWIDSQNIYYDIPSDIEIAKKCKKINLYYEYRAQLKSYTKFYFDPFRRHNRITYFINDNDSIETTIGQLNFFRWIFMNKVLNYALNNIKDISIDMSLNSKTKKKSKETTKLTKQHIDRTRCYIHFD
jgi:hypothetical protein